MNNLDKRLREWNPVRIEDVHRAATDASAARLLQRVINEPIGLHSARGRWRPSLAVWAWIPVLAATIIAVILIVPRPSEPQNQRHHDSLRLVDFYTKHGNVIALITDPDAAASQLNAAFRKHGLNIRVKAVPVSPSIVGTIIFTDAPAIHTVWKPACQVTGCPVGLVIPANFTGSAGVTVGRPARPGETYDSMADAFDPGEALHCSGLLGKPVAAALPVLRKLGLMASWWEQEKNKAEHVPSGFITAGLPLSATKVTLNTLPEVPHDSQFRAEVAAAGRGCAPE